MIDQGAVGGFELREKIGSGGMATVYLAWQKALQRLVVLKIMHPHLAEEGSLAERFMVEARAAAALSHPNIVSVIDCGETDNTSYIAMEFIEGQDLSQLLKAHGKPPLEVSILLLRDICLGLEHAHAEKVIHRDIKPGNIMLDTNGVVKIMDFGLARREEDNTQMTLPGAVMGTPAYMSPEQAGSQPVTERTDIFSLGIMAYELLSGDRPFQGDSYHKVVSAITTASPPPLTTPPIPAVLVTLLPQMLVKDPKLRCNSAELVRMTIEPLIQSLGLTQSTDLLREYVRDPEGCRQRLDAKRAPIEEAADFDSAETIISTIEASPPETQSGPVSEPTSEQTTAVDSTSDAPRGDDSGVKAETPVSRHIDQDRSDDQRDPQPKKRNNLALILVGLLAVSVTVVLLFFWQPWNNGSENRTGDKMLSDANGSISTINADTPEEDQGLMPVALDTSEVVTADPDEVTTTDPSPVEPDTSQSAVIEETTPVQTDPAPVIKKAYAIVCKPAGRIYYRNRCLNADGYFHISELAPGTHRFEVTRTSPPNDQVTFEYRVRPGDSNNKLILNLNTGQVEVDITDLTEFQ